LHGFILRLYSENLHRGGAEARRKRGEERVARGKPGQLQLAAQPEAGRNTRDSVLVFLCAFFSAPPRLCGENYLLIAAKIIF
jgi:hypothetical protein